MKSKSIKSSIMEHFFINPNSRLRVRQIERLLKLPLPSVIRYVHELEKEGLLKRILISGITFFSSDRNNKSYLLQKRIYNLVSLQEMVLFLDEKFDHPTLIVFGSYSKGEDTEESDIDLYLETSSKKEINLEVFEKKLKRNISIIRQRNINELKNKELANNILNGIVLNGYLEVF